MTLPTPLQAIMALAATGASTPEPHSAIDIIPLARANCFLGIMVEMAAE